MKNLGVIDKKSKDYAIQLLKSCGKFEVEVIQFFSTEAHFEFAFQVLQAFCLRLSDFPQLEIIKQSRHPIVDMAFTDPDTDSQHVPVHVMEELLTGDFRLLTKLFYALIKVGRKNCASGVYNRHNFADIADDEIVEMYRSLPTYQK